MSTLRSVRAQHLRQMNQHMVARRVAKLVVDAFEIVDVDERERAQAGVALHAVELAVDLPLEGLPVQQLRQRIESRHALVGRVAGQHGAHAGDQHVRVEGVS